MMMWILILLNIVHPKLYADSGINGELSIVDKIESDSISKSVKDLDEIVITGTRTPKLLKDSPVQTRLISSKDIERTNAIQIEDLLQTEIPGVEFSYAMNQQTHMNFAGFGGQSVLFLVDGERMAGETMDDVDFSRLDINNIERVEIVRGASSALYGSNAGGGVINIISKRPHKKFNLDFKSRFARHGERGYAVSASTKVRNISNILSLSASRIENYDVKNGSNPQTRVVNTIYGHKTLNVNDKLAWNPIDNISLSARVGFFMRELPRDIYNPERYRSYTGSMKGEWKISDCDNLEISYLFDQYDKSQYRKHSGLDIRTYSDVQNSIRAFYTRMFSSAHELTIGVDYLHDFLLNSKLTDIKISQDNFDIFAQHDWQISNKWELVGAIRYDYIHPHNENSSDKDISRLTPKLSIRYKPCAEVNIRTSYGLGFRSPSLKEKYYEFDMSGIWTIKGNPLLKPESSQNVNFSIDYGKGGYNVTAAFNYNYIKNRITTGLPYSLPGDGSQLYLNYINIDYYHNIGAEFTAQAVWKCGISAKCSYAYTHERGVKDKAGNRINDQYMPARPHSITLNADWNKKISDNYILNLAVNGRVLSSVDNYEYKNYYNIAEGTIKIKYPAYTMWKLSVSQTFFKKLKLTFTIDNLFNYQPKYHYLNAPLTDGANFICTLSLNI